MQIRTKEQFIQELKSIRDRGWIKNARPGNQGGVGNTLEDLLGIKENNLPIPNAGEWELKTKRRDSSSLLTLMHLNPSPQALCLVPRLLLKYYGWPHKLAGKKYPPDEMSFRQTISARHRTDRGFGIIIDREKKKIITTFNSSFTNSRHKDWLDSVRKRIGLDELNPQPYWGFDDLYANARSKWLNCFFVLAQRKEIENEEYFHYKDIWMLQDFTFEGFISALESGLLLVDYDARTGHDHGVKFRFRSKKEMGKAFKELFRIVIKIE